jgi:mRNA interferase RelE/StbE
MAWEIELSVEADRELSKLDPQHAKRILKFLATESPTWKILAALASRFGSPTWRILEIPGRDYRLICKIEDHRLLVLVLSIGHHKEIYR